jgi:hypothetical protein
MLKLERLYPVRASCSLRIHLIFLSYLDVQNSLCILSPITMRHAVYTEHVSL